MSWYGGSQPPITECSSVPSARVMASCPASRFRWLIRTPFTWVTEPDVYWMRAMSSSAATVGRQSSGSGSAARSAARHTRSLPAKSRDSSAATAESASARDTSASLATAVSRRTLRPPSSGDGQGTAVAPA